MIFAKTDVSLPHHYRVTEIDASIRAAAFGVWSIALCYTREHLLDGFCPWSAIREIATEEVIEALVAQRLVSRHVDDEGRHGILVLNYSKHNDTRADVEKRLTADRVRKESARKSVGRQPRRRKDSANVPADSPSGIQTDSDRNPLGPGAGFPDSDSLSDSGSGHVDHAPGSVAAAALLPPEDIPITPAVRMRCVEGGAREPTRADVVACLANAKARGLVREDWGEHLVGWMIRGKRFDRGGSSGAPPDAPTEAERGAAERRAREAGHRRAGGAHG